MKYKLNIEIFVWYHYQKIDKYKRKYRGNISVGKFPRDFTDGKFPRYIPRELPWEKNLKQSKKKMMTCHFYRRIYRRNYRRNYRRKYSLGNSVSKFVGKLWTLFIMLITKGITDGKFRRYFPESKSPTDWKVVSVIWRFSEKIQLI